MVLCSGHSGTRSFVATLVALETRQVLTAPDGVQGSTSYIVTVMRKDIFALALAGALASGCTTTDPAGGPGRTDPDYLNPGPVPGKPQMDSLVAGDQKILVYFTGGGDHFRSVCNVASTGAYANTGYTSRSPDTVNGLQNGVEYSCRVWGFSPSEKVGPGSDPLRATPRAP